MFLLWYPAKKSAGESMFLVSVFISGCFYNRLPSFNSDGRESGCPSSVFKKPVLRQPAIQLFLSASGRIFSCLRQFRLHVSS